MSENIEYIQRHNVRKFTWTKKSVVFLDEGAQHIEVKWNKMIPQPDRIWKCFLFWG